MTHKITARHVCGFVVSGLGLVWALAIIVSPLWNALQKLFAMSCMYGVLAIIGLGLLLTFCIVRLRSHQGASIRRMS